MSSYVERYNTRPTQAFQTDYEGILRGLQAKTEYWKIGVQQVRGAYEQAAGLSLTGDRAKGQLKDFMTQADGQLKKALASDLSMYDNASDAVGIYKPLYDQSSSFGREMMSNHSATEERTSAINDANQWRTKDNGKYYSDTNYRDVMNSYQDFKEGMDRGDSAQNYVGRGRQYVPYTDVTKESLDLMAKCKGDQVSQMGQSSSDSLLFETRTDNSLTASKLAGCLGSLSEKARTQLTIEQRVRYHNDPQGLAHAWSSLGEKNVESVADQMQQARLKANQLKADPEQYQYFTTLADSLNDQLKSLQSNLDDINKGDYSDVTNNFDSYAQQLGLYSHARQFGNAYSYTDRATELSGNPANLQRDRQNFEVRQGNTDFQRDVYMENLRSNNDYQRQVQLAGLNNEHDFEVEFFKKFGRKPTAEELLSINSGGALKDLNDVIYTPSQDATIDQNGIKVAQDLHTQLQASSNLITQAGDDLQGRLGNLKQNNIVDPEFFKAFGIDPGKGFNPNMAKDIDGQISKLNMIVESNDKVITQNKINASKGLPQVEPPYQNNTVSAIRDYLATVAEQKRAIAQKSKIIELNEAQIADKIGPEISNFNRVIANEKSVQVRTANGQVTTLTPEQAFDLAFGKKSGNFETKTTKVSSPNGKFQTDSTDDYYNGSPIVSLVDARGKNIGLTNLSDMKRRLKATGDSYYSKKKELTNQIYGQSRFVSNDIHTGIDDTKRESFAREAMTIMNIPGEEGKSYKEIFEGKGYKVIGYTNKSEMVVSTADNNINAESTFTNFGRTIPTTKDSKIHLYAFPSNSVSSNIKPLEGITDNEDLQTLHSAFVKSPLTVGNSEILTNENIRRSKTQSDVPIRLKAFKNKLGQMSYSIETKKPSGQWDTDPKGNYSNIRDWKSALELYGLAAQELRTN